VLSEDIFVRFIFFAHVESSYVLAINSYFLSLKFAACFLFTFVGKTRIWTHTVCAHNFTNSVSEQRGMCRNLMSIESFAIYWA